MKQPFEKTDKKYSIEIDGKTFNYEWSDGYFHLEGSGGVPNSKRQDAETAESIIRNLLPQMDHP